MSIVNDQKYAIRLLLKKPGFALLTMSVMAAGIGLSIYLFSFMNTMIFKDLPFKDGGSIVQISGSLNGMRQNNEINLHDFYEIRNNVKSATEFSAYTSESVNVSGRDGARRYVAKVTEHNMFKITRTKPLLGREFTPNDSLPGAAAVVVIGYDVWQNYFGGDSEVLGKSLRVDGTLHEVIGVMPEGYYFPDETDMWLPKQESATNLLRGEGAGVYGLAHVKDGASLKALNQELDLIMQRIQERYPETNSGVGAYADSIPKTLVADGIAVVYAMHVAAILILILASVNVGNLLLSRAVERGKETAIRVALGAPRSRLISQMLWESIFICGIGGLIGLCVLSWGLSVTEGITATFFDGKPFFWLKFGIDLYTVQIFLFFIVLTVFVTGFLPAWKNSGADFNSVLRDGTRGALGKKSGRLNRFLIISEIFLSLVVLIIASVITVGTYKATHADVGANTDNILLANVQINEKSYPTEEDKRVLVKKIQTRLENNSGIGNVMISSVLPGQTSYYAPTMAVEGREYTQEGNESYPRANFIVTVPGALSKLGVELKEGRYFNSGDESKDSATVLITESFAERHFSQSSPVGKRIRVVEHDKGTPKWLTIVGVVEHTIQGQANSESGRKPTVFQPYYQAPSNNVTLALELRSDRASVTSSLRDVLQSIDPNLPAYNMEMYEDHIERLSAPLRFISSVLLIFGGVAVILAASGIYGVMSNTVNQRTQEIGVKRALGALDSTITKEYLKKGMWQFIWGGVPGLAIGCLMGFAMSQDMGVDSSDLTLIALFLTSVVGGTVMIAAYQPAQKILQLEPSDALRYE